MKVACWFKRTFRVLGWHYCGRIMYNADHSERYMICPGCGFRTDLPPWPKLPRRTT